IHRQQPYKRDACINHWTGTETARHRLPYGTGGVRYRRRGPRHCHRVRPQGSGGEDCAQGTRRAH
ncbi:MULTISPECIES: hypothetical protein, partial [unclassified Prevotella]|uniref:hypothetical protein n=1 Tax=unclassified Prevotella TaxID=2638335 RepID=UPI001C1F6398